MLASSLIAVATPSSALLSSPLSANCAVTDWIVITLRFLRWLFEFGVRAVEGVVKVDDACEGVGDVGVFSPAGTFLVPSNCARSVPCLQKYTWSFVLILFPLFKVVPISFPHHGMGSFQSNASLGVTYTPIALSQNQSTTTTCSKNI